MLDWDKIIITADDGIVQAAAGQIVFFTKGLPGDKGNDGKAATIRVGEVETLEPGEDATVENTGSSSDAVFAFGIPKGEKGDKGEDGEVEEAPTDGQKYARSSGNWSALGGIVVRPDYIISDVDLEDGVSALETGKLYFYYEV